jgi:hypothetical protein
MNTSHFVVVLALCAALAAPAQAAQPISRDTPVSRSETEALVKRDLAERLKVPAERLNVVSASDRTWPDASLGCARKGLAEPRSVPGYAFTLIYAGKRYIYHTDRSGNFKRCDAGKRTGPISR